MMVSPTGSLALTAATVTMGRWSQGKTLSAKPVIGVAFAAVAIAFVSEANAEFAGQFALLILLASLFAYGPSIVKKLGLAK